VRPVCVLQVLDDGAEPRKLGEGLENIAYGRCLLSVVDEAERMWRMLEFSIPRASLLPTAVALSVVISRTTP
jgi:hypothetical protein